MRNITPKQERKMKKRILIVTNHSYMFWQFRKELVEALQKEHEVILAMPFVGHEEDFRKMGIECIPVSMNRRGVNPFAEAKLLRDYKRLLQKSARTLCLHIPLNQISIWVCSAVAKRFPIMPTYRDLELHSKTSTGRICYGTVSNRFPKSKICLF